MTLFWVLEVIVGVGLLVYSSAQKKKKVQEEPGISPSSPPASPTI